MIRSRSSRRGLTLLEVIVAMVIFMASFVVLAQLVAIGTDRALDVKYHSKASILCQDKMELLVLGAEPLESVQGSAFPEPDQDWQYEIEVAAAELDGLKKVRVIVRRERADGRINEVSLSRLIFDPTKRGSTLDKLTTSSGSSGGTTP